MSGALEHTCIKPKSVTPKTKMLSISYHFINHSDAMFAAYYVGLLCNIFIIAGVLNEHSIQLKWWPVQYVGSTGLNMGPRRADVIFVRVNTQRGSDGNKYSRKTHASARLMSFHWISPSFIFWIYHWRFQTMADHNIGSSFIKSTIQCDIIQCEYILYVEIFVNIWSLSSGWPKISTSLSGDVYIDWSQSDP